MVAGPDGSGARRLNCTYSPAQASFKEESAPSNHSEAINFGSRGEFRNHALLIDRDLSSQVQEAFQTILYSLGWDLRVD